MSKQKSAVIYCAFPPVRGVYIEVSKTKGQKQHEKTNQTLFRSIAGNADAVFLPVGGCFRFKRWRNSQSQRLERVDKRLLLRFFGVRLRHKQIRPAPVSAHRGR